MFRNRGIWLHVIVIASQIVIFCLAYRMGWRAGWNEPHPYPGQPGPEMSIATPANIEAATIGKSEAAIRSRFGAPPATGEKEGRTIFTYPWVSNENGERFNRVTLYFDGGKCVRADCWSVPGNAQSEWQLY